MIVKPKTKLNKVFAMLLLWVLAMSSLTGCDNRAEALEFAKSGKTSAETMAKFYESLIKDINDIWELEVFLVNVDREEGDTNEKELKPAQKEKLQTTIDELNKRVKLAQNLAATYRALETLANFDAPSAVKDSATNLASSIKGLKPLEGGVDPSQIFGMIAQDITAWKQSKDLRKGSELILLTVQKLQVLFYREMDAYKSISSEKGRKIKRGLSFCINKKNCTTSPLRKFMEQLDLSPGDVDKASADTQTKFGVLGIVTTRNEKITRMYVSAADGIQQSLTELAANHIKFQNKEVLSLSGIKQGFERAQVYLDAIEKARKENETEG